MLFVRTVNSRMHLKWNGLTTTTNLFHSPLLLSPSLQLTTPLRLLHQKKALTLSSPTQSNQHVSSLELGGPLVLVDLPNAVNLSPAPARRLATKVVVASDDDHDEQDGYETEPAEDDNANNADVLSQSLQAMADADHKVKSYIS